MKGKTLLITGANGFTGQHLINAALKKGYKCIALVRRGHVKRTDVEYIETDLNNAQALAKAFQNFEIHFVIHLAAVSYVNHESISSIYQSNVIGTVNLLDALQTTQSCLQKIIVASSGNIYGEAHAPPITEELRPAPVNEYAASKAAMEIIVTLRSQRMPIITVRPFNYIGLGQAEHFVIPKIIKAFAERADTLELGNLDVARDFSDVRDVCVAYLRLLESAATSETFNICSGSSTPLMTIVQMMKEISRHHVNIVVNKRYVRENEIKDLFGSDIKLVNEIGIYRKFALPQTLNWLWNSKN